MTRPSGAGPFCAAAWAAAGDRVRQAMLEAFVRGTELEWMFLDAAWRRGEWPTARYLEGAA